MADDRPENGDARRDEGPSEPARRTRTPPTIELEAERVDTADADDFAAAQDETAMPPSRRSTLIAALAAGAVAGAVVAAIGWFAAGRGSPAALDASTIATLETFGARLTRLEEAPAPAPRPHPATTARVDADEKAIASLREQLEAVRSKGETLAQAVDAIKAAPREATAASTAAEQPPAEQGATDDQRLAQLEAAVKTVTDEVGKLREARAAPPPAASEIKASDIKASDSSLRRAVHALALDLAVRQGTRYGAELAALRQAGGDDEVLKPLDRFADTGVPDSAALSRDLIAALPKEPAPEPVSTAVRGGWFERLVAGAARLIKLRRIDATEGEGAPADLARVAAAARRGDAATAARDIAALPEPARARFQPWLDQFAARNAALAAAHRTVADAVAALAQTAAP